MAFVDGFKEYGDVQLLTKKVAGLIPDIGWTVMLSNEDILYEDTYEGLEHSWLRLSKVISTSDLKIVQCSLGIFKYPDGKQPRHVYEVQMPEKQDGYYYMMGVERFLNRTGPEEKFWKTGYLCRETGRVIRTSWSQNRIRLDNITVEKSGYGLIMNV